MVAHARDSKSTTPSHDNKPAAAADTSHALPTIAPSDTLTANQRLEIGRAQHLSEVLGNSAGQGTQVSNKAICQLLASVKPNELPAFLSAFAALHDIPAGKDQNALVLKYIQDRLMGADARCHAADLLSPNKFSPSGWVVECQKAIASGHIDQLNKVLQGHSEEQIRRIDSIYRTLGHPNGLLADAQQALVARGWHGDDQRQQITVLARLVVDGSTPQEMDLRRRASGLNPAADPEFKPPSIRAIGLMDDRFRTKQDKILLAASSPGHSPELGKQAMALFDALNGHWGQVDGAQAVRILGTVKPSDMPEFKKIFSEVLKANSKDETTLEQYTRHQLHAGSQEVNRVRALEMLNGLPTNMGDLVVALNHKISVGANGSNPKEVRDLLLGNGHRTQADMNSIVAAYNDRFGTNAFQNGIGAMRGPDVSRHVVNEIINLASPGYRPSLIAADFMEHLNRGQFKDVAQEYARLTKKQQEDVNTQFKKLSQGQEIGAYASAKFHLLTVNDAMTRDFDGLNRVLYGNISAPAATPAPKLAGPPAPDTKYGPPAPEPGKPTSPAHSGQPASHHRHTSGARRSAATTTHVDNKPAPAATETGDATVGSGASGNATVENGTPVEVKISSPPGAAAAPAAAPSLDYAKMAQDIYKHTNGWMGHNNMHEVQNDLAPIAKLRAEGCTEEANLASAALAKEFERQYPQKGRFALYMAKQTHGEDRQNMVATLGYEPEAAAFAVSDALQKAQYRSVRNLVDGAEAAGTLTNVCATYNKKHHSELLDDVDRRARDLRRMQLPNKDLEATVAALGAGVQ